MNQPPIKSERYGVSFSYETLNKQHKLYFRLGGTPMHTLDAMHEVADRLKKCGFGAVRILDMSIREVAAE